MALAEEDEEEELGGARQEGLPFSPSAETEQPFQLIRRLIPRVFPPRHLIPGVSAPPTPAEVWVTEWGTGAHRGNCSRPSWTEPSSSPRRGPAVRSPSSEPGFLLLGLL